MRKAEKAAAIGRILDELHPEPEIPLHHRDPFTLLVSALLSAQTTDKKVNEVAPQLFERASTPAAMAAMGEDAIREAIREIGLAPTKAKRIKALSEQLVRDHDGAVPADREGLQALPGVGRKTASVVLCQGFGVPSFPVDTHIHRLAHRWGLSSGKSAEQTERDLTRLFTEEEWGRRHLQIIYFGRTYCPARNHDFEACPICSWAAPESRRRAERGGGRRRASG